MNLYEVRHGRVAEEAELDGAAPKYYIDGTSEELDLFRRGVTAALMGAIGVGTVTSEEAYDLIRATGRYDQTIGASDGTVLSKLWADMQLSLETRSFVCIQEGVCGRLVSSAVNEELDLIKEFDNLASYEAKLITADGYGGQMTEDGMQPLVWDLDELRLQFGEDSPEYKVASEVGAGLFVEQYARKDTLQDYGLTAVPELVHHETHSTLGTLDDSGDFLPLVTVLGKEYRDRADTE